MLKLAIFLINFYQKTLSPDHGWLAYRHPRGYCRYYPSCSEYVKRALIKKGLFKGLVLGCWRILRCNPWSQGGYDPVEK